MKARLVIVIELALAALGTACEGEPPKAPPSAMGEQTAAPASTDPVEQAVTETAPAASCNPCPVCAPNGTNTVAAVGDAGPGIVATTANASDAGAATVVVAARGDITGKITTAPAYLASVSVVWLEDAPKEPNRGMSARIDNHQMAFTPMVQVITAGGSIHFNNTDPFPHNVFSPDGKFNLGTIAQNSGAAPKRFDKPGAFTILCNLHPNMIGYLVVSPSSYFAKADNIGRYRIKDVPAGTYKITAWAPRLATVTESVTVAGSGAPTTTDFELHR
jgi:plastocyanin